MNDRRPRRLTSRRWDWLAFALPVAFVFALFVIYLVAPGFYLRYILEFRQRETQAVEIITVCGALLAGLILIPTAAAMWRAERAAGGSWFPGGAAMIAVVGFASIFFAGEELSWGQTIFKWKTPEQMKQVSRETNLHNGPLSKLTHEAANLFVLTAFVAAPATWYFRDRLRLPADWRSGMAEWPVGALTVGAMALRGPKELFIRLHSDAELKASTFYWQYLEEIGEQKEMLVAIALFVYAVYRVQAVRRECAALRETSPTLT